jgi:hypothetical protein
MGYFKGRNSSSQLMSSCLSAEKAGSIARSRLTSQSSIYRVEGSVKGRPPVTLLRAVSVGVWAVGKGEGEGRDVAREGH